MRSILVTLLAGALICPAAVHGQAAKARKARKPAASKAASKAKPSKAEASEKAAEQFQAFCQDWMQKLAVRERDNISNIKWNTKPDGVEGEYVGYTQEHTCSVKADGQAPVGRVMYQEVRYAKRGATIAEAQQSTPQPIESTAVTELFRYEKGKWIY